MKSRFRCPLALFAFLAVAGCSGTPQEKMAMHIKQGDEYSARQKVKEAVIEYRIAVKAMPKDAGARWKLAQALIQADEFRSAYVETREVVELDPSNFEAAGKLGEFYISAGEFGKAKMIADNIVLKRPDDPQGYILRSNLAVKDRNIGAAIQNMEEAIRKNPKAIRPMISLGNMYAILLGNQEKAFESFDKAAIVAPESPDPILARGTLFFATGDAVNGEKEFRRAEAKSTDRESVRISLARHFLILERMEDAEKELNALISDTHSQKAMKGLAELRIENGNIAEAKPIVEEILKANGKDLDGKYLKGRILFSEKKNDEAKALFADVLKQDASMSQARLYSGLIDVLKGQNDVGRKEVEEAVKANPRYVRNQLILGQLKLDAMDYDGAEQCAREAIRLNRGSTPAALLYADSLLARRRFEKAEPIYRTVVRQLPDSPVGYAKMGISRKLQNQPKEAADWFAKAYARDPSNSSTLNEYVFALGAAKEVAKAVGIIEQALAREPKNSNLHEIAGRFQVAAGRKEAAEKSFLKAIELSPDLAAPYYHLALLNASQGKNNEAAERLRKVVELNPKNSEAITLLGVVLNAAGKYEESNKRFRDALAISPKNARAANNLAASLSDHGGNLDEALKFAQAAREASPDNPDIADTLGWIYSQKGLNDSAAPLLAEASRKAPNKALVRYHYGTVLARMGKKSMAARELKAALSLDPALPISPHGEAVETGRVSRP